MIEKPADFAAHVANDVREKCVGRDPFQDGTIIERVWAEPGGIVLAIYRVPHIDHPLGLLGRCPATRVDQQRTKSMTAELR